MRKFFISFGTTHNYKISLNRINREALSLNVFDKVIVYTENDFDEKYLEKYGEFMKKNRGYGFWMWKSYFVKKTMEETDRNLRYFQNRAFYPYNIYNRVSKIENVYYQIRQFINIVIIM